MHESESFDSLLETPSTVQRTKTLAFSVPSCGGVQMSGAAT